MRSTNETSHNSFDSKAVLLLGGSGTRLSPTTISVNKHLLPVFDKPMFYYPLSLLISSGVREFAFVCHGEDVRLFKNLVGSGERLGIRIEYFVQNNALGIPDAVLCAESFIGGDPFFLALGDNVTVDDELPCFLRDSANSSDRATICVSPTMFASRFGVATVGSDGRVVNVQEKPQQPESNLAILGLYHFGASGVESAKSTRVSERGEGEVADMLTWYSNRQALFARRLSDEAIWFDAGTPSDLLSASRAVAARQAETGRLVGSPELASLAKGWISNSDVECMARQHSCDYNTLLISALS